MNWEKEFPKLYNIYKSSIQSENNYFNNFENRNKNDYLDLEQKLEKLDDKNFEILKNRVCKYVCKKDKERKYEQLFNALNEVDGYLYLKETYGNASFNNDENGPDLTATNNNQTVILEVKTINWSKKQINELCNAECKDFKQQIPSDLLVKIIKTIIEACWQLFSYSNKKNIDKYIVLLLITCDIIVELNENIVTNIMYILNNIFTDKNKGNKFNFRIVTKNRKVFEKLCNGDGGN